ncbi:uncharacterized protein LOC112602699 [Melanaphis sacchari]|uniref:uncharacterized protein LOC112602699 n=1 Tax=Melanaphis sacchari TaxID=742174 RepID=UPI000DC14C7F|nr:uncharacterized protein LOC112602699 [Melanaphis sacchari]
MKAYHAVELFENNENEDQRKIYEMDKNAAIEYYLQNQMPDISNKSLSTVYWNTEIPRYVFKNYELYVDPTEEIYYLSQIIQADLIYLEKRKTYNTNCRKLTDIEYDEVIILYNYKNVKFKNFLTTSCATSLLQVFIRNSISLHVFYNVTKC